MRVELTAGLLLCLVWSSPAGAKDAGAGKGPVTVPAPPPEAPQAYASVSDPEVVLGERFYVFVEVDHTPGMAVNLPASLPLGAAFAETERESHEEKNPDGTATHHFELALMAFDVGDLEIPPIPVTYAVDGTASEVRTDPIPIRVASYVGDGAEELRDIEPPVRVYRRDWTLLYVLGGVGAVFVAALTGIFLARVIRNRPRRAPAAGRVGVQRKPPGEEALERLAALEASGAIDADDLKPAYHELSEIVRDYLGRKLDFPALDLTTGEILEHLRRDPEAASIGERVRDWLEHYDTVKFAGYPASAEEARQALYAARLFIEETRASSPGTGEERVAQ